MDAHKNQQRKVLANDSKSVGGDTVWVRVPPPMQGAYNRGVV